MMMQMFTKLQELDQIKERLSKLEKETAEIKEQMLAQLASNLIKNDNDETGYDAADLAIIAYKKNPVKKV